MFDDSTERVTVGYDNNTLSSEDLWANAVVPVWKYSINCGFERLGLWENIIWEVLVSSLESWMSLVCEIQLWWWNIEASSPLSYFLLSVLCSGLCLVESLEGSIMSLIKSPCALGWKPEAVHLSSNVIPCLDGACQNRSVSYIKLKTFLLEELSSLDGLSLTLWCQINIMPTCESILKVPG